MENYNCAIQAGMREQPRPFKKEGLGHPPGKEPGPAEVLAESKGIWNGVVREGSYKYQL